MTTEDHMTPQELRSYLIEAFEGGVETIFSADKPWLKKQALATFDALVVASQYDPNDPDYSPAYQDAYARLWHKAEERVRTLQARADRAEAALREVERERDQAADIITSDLSTYGPIERLAKRADRAEDALSEVRALLWEDGTEMLTMSRGIVAQAVKRIDAALSAGTEEA